MSMHHGGTFGQPNPSSLVSRVAARTLQPRSTDVRSARLDDLPLPLQTLDPAVQRLLQKHNLLRSLVEREVVSEAIEDLVFPAEQLEQALAQYCQQQGLADDEALTTHLKQRGLHRDDLLHQLRVPALLRQYCAEHYSHKAEARFLARKNELDRVVYSLLRVKDPYLAQELYLRVAAGEANFADLAASYAEGPERNTKGIVGPVPLTQAHPVLAERLRTATPGVLMEPIRIADWFLVVRLESYTPASFDEGIAAQMSRELLDQWVDEESSRIIAILMERSEGVATA